MKKTRKAKKSRADKKVVTHDGRGTGIFDFG